MEPRSRERLARHRARRGALEAVRPRAASRRVRSGWPPRTRTRWRVVELHAAAPTASLSGSARETSRGSRRQPLTLGAILRDERFAPSRRPSPRAVGSQCRLARTRASKAGQFLLRGRGRVARRRARRALLQGAAARERSGEELENENEELENENEERTRSSSTKPAAAPARPPGAARRRPPPPPSGSACRSRRGWRRARRCGS